MKYSVLIYLKTTKTTTTTWMAIIRVENMREKQEHFLELIFCLLYHHVRYGIRNPIQTKIQNSNVKNCIGIWHIRKWCTQLVMLCLLSMFFVRKYWRWIEENLHWNSLMRFVAHSEQFYEIFFKVECCFTQMFSSAHGVCVGL